jgi:beta-mannosidase
VFQPVIVALEPIGERLWVWVCNDLHEPVTVRLTLGLQPWTGAPASQRTVNVTVPANASVKVTEARHEEISAHGMFVCNLEGPANTDRATYFPGLPHEMALPSALLRVRQEGGPREGTLTVSTHCYARVVSLDADLDFSDNYFDLVPGESRTVTWSSPGKDYPGTIPVGCWNGKAGP